MVCDKSDSPVEAGRKMIEEADDDIVVSGIAGSFPDAEGLEELGYKLFNKIDLISDDDRRWKLDHPEIPQRTGKLKEVNKFDASSFGIHYNQAQCMDPMTRILLEKSYEAIIDSGFNPYSLRGSNTGVFIGACFSESEKTWFYEKLQVDGFGVTGCTRTMLANRISYAFGLDGPSYIVDTACSSSMYALEQGYNAIRQGHCDSALVGGCNLCLHPYVSLQFARLGVLSLDGRCKVFDEGANGYCRSEAIAVLFLQKKRNSRRIYATLVHAKTNCDGYKEQGITYPSGEMQQQLLEEFYQECMIDPSSLAWVEAHGTGTKVGDPEEVRALYNVFCKNRSTPLPIGSIKSNLGHTEPSSGMCSIAKVIIAMETGLIPPNINFKTPRVDIEYFQTGEMTVITDPTPWDGGMVGINSFGFGGANCHALLKWNEKSKKNCGLPDDDLPRLVNVSGRTVEAVETILAFLESSNLDAEFVKLLHDIHKDEIPSHLYRGYTILTKDKSLTARDIKYTGMKKPLYLEFTGLCKKWKPFDRSLLNFPTYKQSLKKMGAAISIDIAYLITSADKTISNPVDFFVSIVASQIALYDLLQYIGIKADGYMGISIGNLVCAYADGYLTAEETILIAYNLGTIIMNASNSGIKKSSVLNNIDKKNDTWILSQGLLMSLKPKIMEVLKKTIRNETVNVPKWLNTLEKKDFSIADVIFQNLVSSTNFSEDDDEFSEDYLVLSVEGKGIYEHNDLTMIKMFDNDGRDDMTCLLITIGKLFMEGVESDISKLYPAIEYPVSRSTPMIAPLIRWNHTDDWYVTSYQLQKKIASGERTITVNVSEEETEYISGHVIDGRNLFPATGYLFLVWETVALIKGEHSTEVPIVFEDVRFLRATNMTKDGSVDFTVIVQRASGMFEVVEGGAPIVTGRVYVPDDISKEMSPFEAPVVCNKPCTMLGKDIYKELRLRGYNYKGLFRSLTGMNIEEKFGLIKWHKNWVAFMDNMLQIQILQFDTRGLFVPTSIEKVIIDGRKHVQSILTLGDDQEDIAVYYHKESELIKSGGVEIRGLRANAISRRKVLAEAILEKYLFIPNTTEEESFSLEDIVRIYMQIILENEPTIHVKAVELHDNNHNLLAPIIAEALSDLPLIQPEIMVLGTPEIPEDDPLPPEVTVEDKKISNDQSALLVSATNVLNSEQSLVLESCLNALKAGGYLISRENLNTDFEGSEVTLLCSHVFNNEKIMLLRKNKKVEAGMSEVYYVSQADYSWLTPSQNAIKSKEIKKVVFVGKEGAESGVLGFVNCVRKEPEGQKARCVLLMDNNVPEFSLENKMYETQLSKELAINVYKHGQWGTYRHLKMDPHGKTKAAHIYAHPVIRGDLSSLSWIKGNISDERCFNPGDEKVLYISYASLNFRDIMLASGKLAPEAISKNRKEQDHMIGFEYSGVDSKGNRLMGLQNSSALSSMIKYEGNLHWNIPDEWSLEEAATVPCTYGTVLFALILRGRMKRGESILIHAGSGGVGQAAINISLALGCEVFTTVGTPEKRKFIKETFPQIDDRHIGNSRDTSFEQLIMQETHGRGVDMVLNSLAEEKLLASVRCLAEGGRFLEIGKFDLVNNNPLGMEVFAKGISFHGILLDAFFDAEEEAKNVLHKLLDDFLNMGFIKPLCRHVFPKEEIETAFRFMASGKHIGKVLLQMRDEKDSTIPIAPRVYDAVPRFYCKPGKSYIIIGGLGGFGLELADWLFLRGATKLILTSRKGVSNGYQPYRMNLWKLYGVEVQVLTDDVTTAEGAENILRSAARLGPVDGIFNLAVNLMDAIYENQTEESFRASLAPKAMATKHLDQLSRKLCPELEQFVIFSSVSCGRGNGGQTNYGMANSVMERICESRVSEGLPGLAIQWGAVGDVGLVAEMMDDNIEIVIGGTLQQRITSCLEVMDQFLIQKHPIVASMVVAEKKSGHSSSGNIVDTVVNILGIRDLKTVSFHSNLAELGMDSMMAVEIKQTLEREFEVFLSPQDIRGMTIAKLQEIAAAKESSEEKTEHSEETQAVIADAEEYIVKTISEPETYKQIIKLESLDSTSTGRKKIIMIPGLEGFPIIFENIAKKLNLETYALQLDYTTYYDNVRTTANSFLPVVTSYFSDKTFNIVGYSYGGLIAVELANQLESMGYTGKVILIDSSPSTMVSLVKANFSENIDDTMQVQVIMKILQNIIPPNKKSEIEDLLKVAPDWDSRLEIITATGKQVLSFSVNFMKQLLNATYNRVKSILNYEGLPPKSISSPVTLIRPTTVLKAGSQDFGLSEYCAKPVSVHVVEGDHRSVLTNPRTPQVIQEVFSCADGFNPKSPLSPPTDIGVLSDPTKQI